MRENFISNLCLCLQSETTQIQESKNKIDSGAAIP